MTAGSIQKLRAPAMLSQRLLSPGCTDQLSKAKRWSYGTCPCELPNRACEEAANGHSSHSPTATWIFRDSAASGSKDLRPLGRNADQSTECALRSPPSPDLTPMDPANSDPAEPWRRDRASGARTAPAREILRRAWLRAACVAIARPWPAGGGAGWRVRVARGGPCPRGPG
jgi:hypothetical protein